MPASCASPAEAEAELQAHQQPELYRETLSQRSVISKRKRKSLFIKDPGPCPTDGVHERRVDSHTHTGCDTGLRRDAQAALPPTRTHRAWSHKTKQRRKNHARGCHAAREVTRQVFCSEFQAIQASQGVQGQPGLQSELEASLSCRLSVKSAWVT